MLVDLNAQFIKKTIKKNMKIIVPEQNFRSSIVIEFDFKDE